MMKKILTSMIASALCIGGVQAEELLDSKPASKFTEQQNYTVLSELPFSDRQDFEFAKKV